METKETEKDAGLDQLPVALVTRGQVVELEGAKGKHVVVTKWTLSKSQLIVKWVSELFEKASVEDKKTLDSGDVLKIATMAMSTWGDRLIVFLKLCVRRDDEALITPDLELEDALGILVAVIEMNFTDGMKKKVARLMEALPRKSAEGGSSTR